MKGGFDYGEERQRRMITKIEDIQSIVNEIARQQIEYTERTLAGIITKYDFIVGSMECKCKLMDILPKGANIIYSPFVANPTMIYAIKKFDIMDLFENPYRAESEDKE